MPKFFGVDTVLWYYPEKSPSGCIFYAIALLATGVAAWPFIRSPSKIAAAVRGGVLDAYHQRDLLLLVLIIAAFVFYMNTPVPRAWPFFVRLSFFSAPTG